MFKTLRREIHVGNIRGEDEDKIFIGKPPWKCSMKVEITEMVCEGLHCTEVTQGGVTL
jgi:hypothetical protein